MIREAKYSVLAVLALALAAGIAPAAAAEPFEIPVVLPLTGGGAFPWDVGEQSLQLVEKMVNAHGGIKGRPIHFAVADDQSNPQVAVQLTNAVLAKKPPVILGSAVVGMCNAMAAIVKANGPVPVLLLAGHPSGGQQLHVLLEREYRRPGDGIAALLPRQALEPRRDHHVDGRERSRCRGAVSRGCTAPRERRAFDHLARALQPYRRNGERADLAHPSRTPPTRWWHGRPGTPFGTLLHGISDAGLDIPVMGGNGNLTYPQLAQYKSFTPKQMYFASPRFFAREQVRPGPIRDAQDLFFNAFAKIGVKPDVSHSFSWDPALIVVDALRHAGTDASPEAIRTYVEGLHGWAGINGLYDFRDGSQRGLSENTAIVIRWNGADSTFTGVTKPGGAPLK